MLRRYLLAGYDVELVSPRGNGGTRFLREFLVEAREHGQTTLFLPDVGEERPLPSALVSALAEQGRGVPAGALNSPVELAAHMERVFGTRPLTLVVDGANALPPLLLAAIAHYRASAQLQIVVLLDREGAVLPRSSQAVMVHLPALTLEEMGAVLNGACGAPFEPSTMSRIYADAGGLVKLALAVSEVGIIEGNLKMVDAQWVATQELWSNRLVPLVRRYVAAESETDLEALEMLSVAGLAATAEAIEMVGEAQLEQLERRRLVSIEATGMKRWVTVNPPLLGEMYRHGKSSARLTRVTARVEQVTARKIELADVPQREIRITKIGPLVLRQVAERRAVMMREARHAWEATPTAETGLRFVETLVELDAPPWETLRVIAEALEAPTDNAQYAWLRVWEARVRGYQLGDLSAALEALERHAEEAGEHRGLLVAVHIRLLADLATLPEDAEEQLLSYTEGPIDVRSEVHRELVNVHYVRGHLGSASEVIRRAETWGDTRLRARLQVFSVLVALGQGKFERARELVMRGIAAAKDQLDAWLLREHVFVGSLLLVVRGQGLSMARHLDLATALGSVPAFPQAAYLGTRVCGALSVNGSVEEIRQLTERLSELNIPGGTAPGTSRAWLEAKLASAEGDAERAANLCWDDALELRNRGGYLAAAHAGLRALEYQFVQERAQHIERWLQGIDSEQLHALHAFLTARACGTEQEAMESIPRLAATGQAGHAMQAYRDLVKRASRHGDGAWVERIQQERQRFTETLANGGIDLLQVVASETKMTRREMEVARLIAAGLSNRQIQDELVLSIRTVENHVHRLMRKLRVTTRQEVVESVHGWVLQDTSETS